MKVLRHALFALLPALMLAPVLHAASNDIFVDNASSGVVRGNATLTFSHTVGSGSNRYLVIGVSISNTNAVDVTNPPRYGGVAMTFVGAQATTGSNERVEMWQMI